MVVNNGTQIFMIFMMVMIFYIMVAHLSALLKKQFDWFIQQF